MENEKVMNNKELKDKIMRIFEVTGNSKDNRKIAYAIFELRKISKENHKGFKKIIMDMDIKIVEKSYFIIIAVSDSDSEISAIKDEEKRERILGVRKIFKEIK